MKTTIPLNTYILQIARRQSRQAISIWTFLTAKYIKLHFLPITKAIITNPYQIARQLRASLSGNLNLTFPNCQTHSSSFSANNQIPKQYEPILS